MKLRDFQVVHGVPRAVHRSATPPGHLSYAQYLQVAQALVPFSEAVRMWLKTVKTQAPFAKVLVELTPYEALQSKVSIALGICHAHVLVSMNELLEKYEDYAWLSRQVLDALANIRGQLGWFDEDLDEQVRRLASQHPLCDHELVELRLFDRKSRTHCSTRYVSDIGMTRVDVVFQRDRRETGRVAVKSESRAFTLEDEFPVVRARLQNGNYQLIGRSGSVLATVALPVV